MTTPLSPEFLSEAFAREMASAVAALLGESTTVTPAAVPAAPTAWRARIEVAGALRGHLDVGLSDADGRRVSALVMGFESGEVGDDAVADTLRELCGQAVGALKEHPETAGVTLAVRDVGAGPLPAALHEAWQFPLTSAGASVLPVIVLAGTLAASTAAVEPGPVAPPTAAAAAPTLATAAPTLAAAAPAPPGGNLDLLLDIELPLSVRFGQTELTLLHLTRLGPGSVIDLHRSADEPVDVLVSGKVIARGEVVVVEGNYGVRVTEVVSTADRIRSMGA
jgi:flagellar motor switch protein FliN